MKKYVIYVEQVDNEGNLFGDGMKVEEFNTLAEVNANIVDVYDDAIRWLTRTEREHRILTIYGESYLNGELDDRFTDMLDAIPIWADRYMVQTERAVRIESAETIGEAVELIEQYKDKFDTQLVIYDRAFKQIVYTDDEGDRDINYTIGG